MQFKFDANQSFQVQAIDSVVDLFLGQGPMDVDYSLSFQGGFQAMANRLDLDDERLLEYLRAVQERNGIDANRPFMVPKSQSRFTILMYICQVFFISAFLQEPSHHTIARCTPPC